MQQTVDFESKRYQQAAAIREKHKVSLSFKPCDVYCFLFVFCFFCFCFVFCFFLGGVGFWVCLFFVCCLCVFVFLIICWFPVKWSILRHKCIYIHIYIWDLGITRDLKTYIYNYVCIYIYIYIMCRNMKRTWGLSITQLGAIWNIALQSSKILHSNLAEPGKSFSSFCRSEFADGIFLRMPVSAKKRKVRKL